MQQLITENQNEKSFSSFYKIEFKYRQMDDGFERDIE